MERGTGVWFSNLIILLEEDYTRTLRSGLEAKATPQTTPPSPPPNTNTLLIKNDIIKKTEPSF